MTSYDVIVRGEFRLFSVTDFFFYLRVYEILIVGFSLKVIYSQNKNFRTAIFFFRAKNRFENEIAEKSARIGVFGGAQFLTGTA
jgi:hypothetical protein